MEIKDIAFDIYSEFKGRAKNRLLSNALFGILAIQHADIINLVFGGNYSAVNVNKSVENILWDRWNLLLIVFIPTTMLGLPYLNILLRNFYYERIYKTSHIKYLASKVSEEEAKYKLTLARTGVKKIEDLEAKLRESGAQIEQMKEMMVSKETFSHSTGNLQKEIDLKTPRLMFFQNLLEALDKKEYFEKHIARALLNNEYPGANELAEKYIIAEMSVEEYDNFKTRYELDARIQASSTFNEYSPEDVIDFLINPTETILRTYFSTGTNSDRVIRELQAMDIYDRFSHLERILRRKS